LRAFGLDARVGRVDAIDVRVALAARAQHGSEAHGREVGGAAAQRRHVEVLGDALEAGDDDDASPRQLLPHALRLNADDACAAVHGVGAHAGLGAGEADRLVAHGVQLHRHEGAGDDLACGQQDVHLAVVRVLVDLVREVDEVVGRIAHGRDHGDDVVALLLAAHDAFGDSVDAFGVSYGATAVFLDDKHAAILGERFVSF
jgi:hypothetical protein